MGIFYNNKNLQPPFPNFNNLERRINYNRSSYLNSNETDKLINLFDEAQNEIIDKLNYLCRVIENQIIIINQLHKKIQIMEIEYKNYDKWLMQQKGRKQILTEEQKRKIIELKKMNVSNRKIANKFNVSEGTVRNLLKSENLPFKATKN